VFVCVQVRRRRGNHYQQLHGRLPQGAVQPPWPRCLHAVSPWKVWQHHRTVLRCLHGLLQRRAVRYRCSSPTPAFRSCFHPQVLAQGGPLTIDRAPPHLHAVCTFSSVPKHNVSPLVWTHVYIVYPLMWTHVSPIPLPSCIPVGVDARVSNPPTIVYPRWCGRTCAQVRGCPWGLCHQLLRGWLPRGQQLSVWVRGPHIVRPGQVLPRGCPGVHGLSVGEVR
jgi:hypothetical protein